MIVIKAVIPFFVTTSFMYSSNVQIKFHEIFLNCPLWLHIINKKAKCCPHQNTEAKRALNLLQLRINYVLINFVLRFNSVILFLLHVIVLKHFCSLEKF